MAEIHRKHETETKAMNILILNESESKNDDLEVVINQDKFVIHECSSFENYTPNVEDTALIICLNSLDMASLNNLKILNYFKYGGNVLSLNFKSEILNSVRGICCQKLNEETTKFWIKQSSQWISTQTVSSQALKSSFPQFCKTSTNSEKPQLTPAFLLTRPPGLKITDEKQIQQTKLTLDFDPKDANCQATNVYLPIYKTNCPDFNWKQYYDLLKTEHLGQVVIHSKVVNSTFDILEGPKSIRNGLAVIAERQINGRGRGQNVWISPVGCAMTSFQMEFNLNSKQGEKASILQHLVSLSVVHALKDLLELNLKWPNDIYLGKKIKMGGVVVLSSVMRNFITFNIGLGFNLNNEEPTLSFNQLLKESGKEPISQEEYFAKVFNQLEAFLNLIETDPLAMETILELYHHYWLHQNQGVEVVNEDNERQSGVVQCIDQDGFLVVQLPDGSLQSVQPGNNSFDMMQGLILPKK